MVVEVRNVLIDELNKGEFNSEKWKAFASWAGINGYKSIQAQMEKYIEHYSEKREDKNGG